MKDVYRFMIIFTQFFLEGEMYQTKAVEKIKTLCVSSTIFPKMIRGKVEECCQSGEVTYENILGACSLHAGYLRFRYTLIICNIYCFSTAAVVTRMHLNVTFIRTLPVLFCFHPLHGRQCSRHGSHGKIEIISGNIIIIITIPIKLHIISKIFKAEEPVE